MTHTERIRETLATVSRAPREELCEIVGELEKARLVVYSRMAQPEREPEDQFIGVEEAGRMLGLGGHRGAAQGWSGDSPLRCARHAAASSGLPHAT